MAMMGRVGVSKNFCRKCLFSTLFLLHSRWMLHLHRIWMLRRQLRFLSTNNLTTVTHYHERTNPRTHDSTSNKDQQLFEKQNTFCKPQHRKKKTSNIRERSHSFRRSKSWESRGKTKNQKMFSNKIENEPDKHTPNRYMSESRTRTSQERHG